jgi:N-methylhydantoinase A
MLATDLRHDLVRTVLAPLAGTDAGWAESAFREMQAEIEAILPPVGAPVVRRAVDLRYLGQEHTVAVPVPDLGRWAGLREAFDAAHRQAYGYAASEVPVQLLNLRLAVTYPMAPPRLAEIARATGAPVPVETRKVFSTRAQDALEYGVYARAALGAGHAIEGPAAIEEPGTTTLLEPGDRLTVEPHGCLVITCR